MRKARVLVCVLSIYFFGCFAWVNRDVKQSYEELKQKREYFYEHIKKEQKTKV